ncbi:MAG: class I mannose-6-phosphate isomerase [Prolixibacteraceae bacterium]|nr:class I mannose-6-phosphate isomerase [Prolixibacteraceae bacterium]
MSELYPLKFKPIFIEKIWGGKRLKSLLNKNTGTMENCGESWELSGVEGNISVVQNGFLAGNELSELIEVYMGELVGDKVYEKFGIEFPLLIKFIDANADLSVQVHPNDELAFERHKAFGKTEMWYVINAEEGAKINTGFNQQVTREKYIEYFEAGRLNELLRYEDVHVGDVFFVPAGWVHAIGTGVMVAEIQQTSDITYRIFDYNRKDTDGNYRELHADLALDAIDYSSFNDSRISYRSEANKSTELVSCNYFTTNILEFNTVIEKDYFTLDSFVIYIAIDGNFSIEKGGEKVGVMYGDTILLPAITNSVTLIPETDKVKLLEVYIK